MDSRNGTDSHRESDHATLPRVTFGDIDEVRELWVSEDDKCDIHHVYCAYDNLRGVMASVDGRHHAMTELEV